VGSIVTLNCDLGARWRQSGGQGDASDYFAGLVVNPEDGCLVCSHSNNCYFTLSLQVFMEFTYSGVCAIGGSKDDNDDNIGWPGLIILLL